MPIENPAETKIASEPHRRYRDDILQLGLKKKAYIVITRPAPYNLILRPAASRIHLLDMAAILAARCTPYATSKRY